MIIRILAVIGIFFSISYGNLASDIEERIENSGISKENISISIKETGKSGKRI
ncbi:MAG: hypothetical protein IE880_05015, partial [Epsilonproteobacteria bacterium]|nr:hypothetical protein [Campylobacterota bacterium]